MAYIPFVQPAVRSRDFAGRPTGLDAGAVLLGPCLGAATLLALIGIPLTYSIADGMALSFVSDPLLKLLAGRGREVRWPMVVLAVFLLYYYACVRPRVG